MNKLVSFTKHDDVGVITINNPPVNAISPGVPEGIGEAIDAANQDDSIKAIVIIGSGNTFISGADLKEFQKMTAGESAGGSLLPFLLKIEDSPKPAVAAIHGTAFGGGLEIAMAFHYRVAAPGAFVGQPEVKLGIIPGAAGSQRLPRLAGIAKAVEMCALGEPLKATAAFEFGIVDKIIEGDLLEGAIKFARELVASKKPPRKPREQNGKLGNAQANAAIFAEARKVVRQKMRGQTAPLVAIEAVEGSTKFSFEEGCKKEAELFTECLFGNQSKSLIHAFFSERAVSKIPDIPKDTPMFDIKKAAVIGAGTMGGGIAMNYVNAGIPVLIKETSRELLDKGIGIISKNYANSVKNGRFGQDVMDKRMALIKPTLTYDGFEDVDIVAEAVFEGMALKKQIFAELDKICKPTAILATNTSTLNIDEIASATSRPEFVIGHHYFSPANVMRLLEIVRGKDTSKSVIATSLLLAKRLKKVGVLVGNCRGFVGNRMLACYLREAQFLVEEGARVEAVDAALYEFGMAMGPLAMGDLAGLDVGWRIRKEYRHLEKPGERQPMIADELCELGRFGQKTGAGWYRYDENRKPIPDSAVYRLIEQLAADAGIRPRQIAPAEIIERTIYALVNEGAKILEEGFALRASDIDIIYLYGYGFPAWRGGPMWYADTVGLKNVYSRIRDFNAQQGEQWQPAPLLKQLAEQGRTFADLDKEKTEATTAG